jgi:hypothetical protein
MPPGPHLRGTGQAAQTIARLSVLSRRALSCAAATLTILAVCVL